MSQSVVNVAPLAVVALLCSILAITRVHRGLDRLLTRIAIRLFGDYIDEFRTEHPNRQSALRAAQFSVTYREYGSKTMLYAAVLAIVGAIVGIYAIWGLLQLLAIDPDTMREALPGALEFLANFGGVPTLSAGELFALVLVSSVTIGTLAGTGTYWLRWWYPGYVADERARRIETALPSTVAFVYALSKSGMEFPKVVRIVAAQDETYGEAATEFQVAVRNMDTFGMDLISALQEMGHRTPSPQFQEFTENLASVLQSGHSLSEFLERQYHDYQEESESQQESTIELLGTLAEAYVTVLVAGPLFLITILVVIGIAVGDTIGPLQALIYLILPFANLGFIVYLSVVTNSITPGSTVAEDDGTAGQGTGAPFSDASRPETAAMPRADGGDTISPNVERLRYYRRIDRLRGYLSRPIETLLERPNLALAITVPIALLVVLQQLPAAFAGSEFDPTVVDDTIAVAAFLVLSTFAVCYELHRRRVDAIEAAVPDLLDRLASVNEAGMSVVAGFDKVRDSELGPLGTELDRVWADVQWGSDLQTALRRFERRVRTRATSRVVTLLTEAMNASGNLSTVLRIAARQAATDRRLKRERKQAMMEYTIVVYVSFFVFLFIIAVLGAYLIPNLPTEGVDPAGGAGPDVDGLGGFNEGDADIYSTLFYHATLVQGLLSGLIAGQLSTGDVRAGAKHAAAMIALTVLLFTVIA
ncbi:type II secretion system F family protein [Halobiforma nitratireducens]|uniref:Type II secretion system F domain-containing protein n=1 Tax=Halobiforma nitratireducens JCM 10879 TaxID=1227454 RepID=M0M5H6_9EURY|nr:type II secretion system F family protein [Halobiforma nitratireducens]EMA39879.1 type II secretion system F domain-containing protein [Halobiforma nitratireducens JCM 10879]